MDEVTKIRVSKNLWDDVQFEYASIWLEDKDGTDFSFILNDGVDYDEPYFILNWYVISSETRNAGYGSFNPAKDIIFKVRPNRGAPLRSFDETCELTEKLQPGATYYLDHLNCELILEDYGAGGGDCIIGSWRQDLTDCDDPNAYKTFQFNSDGSGKSTNVIVQGYGAGCAVMCRVTFEWSWTQSSDGSITIDYKDVYQDGGCSAEPQLPTSSSVINVSCNGSSLSINGQTYERQ